MVQDELVLVVPERGEARVLNEVGARIWQRADGQRTIRTIAATICAEYAVEPHQAEADALAFVADLVGRGLFVLA